MRANFAENDKTIQQKSDIVCPFNATVLLIIFNGANTGGVYKVCASMVGDCGWCWWVNLCLFPN